jgi:hypothetical protein
LAAKAAAGADVDDPMADMAGSPVQDAQPARRGLKQG